MRSFIGAPFSRRRPIALDGSSKLHSLAIDWLVVAARGTALVATPAIGPARAARILIPRAIRIARSVLVIAARSTGALRVLRVRSPGRVSGDHVRSRFGILTRLSRRRIAFRSRRARGARPVRILMLIRHAVAPLQIGKASPAAAQPASLWVRGEARVRAPRADSLVPAIPMPDRAVLAPTSDA